MSVCVAPGATQNPFFFIPRDAMFRNSRHKEQKQIAAKVRRIKKNSQENELNQTIYKIGPHAYPPWMSLFIIVVANFWPPHRRRRYNYGQQAQSSTNPRTSKF